MNKCLRFLIVCCALLLNATELLANQRDSIQAERIAVNFLQKYASGRKEMLKLSYVGRNSKHKIMYIFNRGTSNGYIMVSADDATEDVLMYSESGKFSWEDLPMSMKTMINDYGRQIAFAIENPDLAEPDYRAPLVQNIVKPLVATKWGQYPPYNSQCPVKSGKRCATGCVATAMAQIMNFYKYPTTAYNWNLMANSYASNAVQQSSAVAKLMHDCGMSVKSTYGVEETSAAMINTVEALREMYGYDYAMQYDERVFYTDDEWKNIIFNELRSGRPLLYSIHTELGAHTFICDGFNQLGYLHYNMGWNGDENGYYLISALKPKMAEKFTFTACTHYIVSGIRPSTGKKYYGTEMRCFGSLTSDVVTENGEDIFELKGSFQNYSMFCMSAVFGCFLHNEANGSEFFVPYQHFTNMASRNFFGRIRLKATDVVEKGSYLVYPAYVLDGTKTVRKMKLQRGLQPQRLTANGDTPDVLLASMVTASMISGGRVEVTAQIKTKVDLTDAEVYAFVFPENGGNSLMYTEPVKLTLSGGCQKTVVMHGNFPQYNKTKKYLVAVYIEIAGQRAKMAPTYLNDIKM